MEGGQGNKERSLSRGWEGQRLQDQLLALAYEQLWPVLQVRLRPSQPTRDRRWHEAELQRACGG